MELRDDINEFLAGIDKNVLVVPATKYVDSDDIKKLYSLGLKDFGENRVEVFLDKYDKLSDLDIKWHFIGHLQRNKAKLVANKIDVLHSLDSVNLAIMLDKLRNKPLDCFIEVSINLEENKNGVDFHKINDFINEIKDLKNINIIGFMMMTVKASSHDEYLKQFKALNYLKCRVEKDLNIKLPYLSMGMSDDYKEAIEAGATHIRLGRVLWKM